MKLKNHIIILILIMFISVFIGVSAANSSNQKDITYYALLEPDLEGNAYFHINVQNFNYNNSRIFGIAILIPTVENYTLISENKKSYDYYIITPNASIDILYSNGQIETVNYYKGELEFLGNFYFGLPVPSQMYYVNVTDKIRNEKLTNFDIKFYDFNYNSDKHYDKYPFDYYSFTYDIIFLNETNVVLSVSPSNPNNFYEINVSLNHIYKNKYGLNFEEQINPVYDGVYKINFKTKQNESVDSINIIYMRKTGLPQISFYVLLILMVSMIIIFFIIFKNKIPKELNAIVFGTFLTIYTFSSSIGYAYKPSWLETVSYFDILFILDTIFIFVYFTILIIKWKE